MARSSKETDRREAGRPAEIADVVIVGGGVIGLSCAWRAAQAGLSTVLVERGGLGTGASPVAAGMLAPAGEAQWGQGPLADACIAAAQGWGGFAAELEAETGMSIAYSAAGALHVALDRDEAAELRRRLPLIEAVDPDTEWCLPSRCRELEPGLAPAAGPGIRIPGEASVDTSALLAALHAAAIGAGARLIEGDGAAGLEIDGDRAAGVRLESGTEIAAGRIVIAAGAWSGVLDWLPREARPEIRPVKGEVLRLRSRSPLAAGIVHTERVYVVQRPSGEIIVGATMEDAGFDVTVGAGGVHELLREAYRVLPDIAECEFSGAVAGLRPATPDGAPYLGETAIPGLHLACGHFRNGVLLAPLSAAAIVAGLTGAEVPAPVRPFGIVERTVDKAVAP